MTRNVFELKIDGTIKEFIDEKNNHYQNSIFKYDLLNEYEQKTKLENYDELNKATMTIHNIVALHLMVDYTYQAYLMFKTSDGREFSIHAEGLNVHLVNSSYTHYSFRDGEYVSETQTLVSYINGHKEQSNYILEDEKDKFNFFSSIQYKQESMIKNVFYHIIRRK